MSAVPMTDDRVRVLIVDDTPDIRLLLRMSLERYPAFRVVGEAGNGLEAHARAREEPPDVVLLDLAMPVMDGLAALPGLRRIVPRATIIVLSGFGADRMAERALSAGADGYLQKGASPTTIVEYVSALVSERSVVPLSLGQRRRAEGPVAEGVEGEKVAADASGVLDAALRLAPYGVVVLRLERDRTVVVDANPAAVRMLGATGAIDDRPLGEVDESFASLVERHRAALSANRAVDVELTAGATPLEVRLRGEGGLIACYLDDRPAGREGALLRQALATVAHEIRNPVVVLQGIAETLGLDQSPDRRAQLTGAIARQARVLERVTADLLGAAQARHGKLEVQVEPVRLADVITHSVQGVPNLDDVDVIGDAAVRVMADPLRLQQILANLLVNAVKYGAPPIAIRLEPLADQVRISVEDRGPGVPAAFRPLLFTEFARAAQTTSRGTGLGLYVVRSLVEAQGGQVDHEDHPENGSIFRVTLPSAPEDGPRA
ncbi:ATP-binding protein [Nocardioides stalactiti]|uniref:ATP-binding protein n=1 Tax=Nocardioides stalactiti TaxID=2755356 RepID=UPI0016014D5E|nr:ATP-binding protein [Nocardioides stalactiti]